MKRQFCLPCFLELKKAGKHDITRIAGGKNLKITCWRCKRRRYGAEYEISRKGGARPAYLRGGSYNDYLEYGRLKDLIAKECIEAFKAGFRFEKEATP